MEKVTCSEEELNALQWATLEYYARELNYRNGLIARFTGTDGVPRVRLDEEIAFAWGTSSPDRRVPPGAFTATFAGQLR